ncbi:hypothetical protein [Segetibacter sp.]|jgi:hypothetical protein|uniref:condensin complex protein MksE n=1 Tax=Segetibacter sp. TaxID=2231182 RepID=UPI00262C0ADD|nr:hypothetical protein [Segetibacter sp.]MCW3082187.1 hypothetical protein [Segetibacter sp.]
MNMPGQAKEIFEKMSKGDFICSNSVEDSNRKLFNIIDDNFEDLYTYFSAIGFNLEKGDEYFYFSRDEARASLEDKIEQVYRWIDILDFFKAFDNGFSSGYRFTASDIITQMKMDASLNDKLQGMKKLTGEGTQREKVQALIERVKKYGVIELENEINEQYKVLSSFKYLEQLIISVHISEEVKHEIS